MRDLGRVNRSVLPHWVRRMVGKAPKRSIGMGAAGCLWQRIVDTIMPITETVNAIGGAGVSKVQVGTLGVTKMLQLLSDGAGPPLAGANFETQWVTYNLPSSGRLDDVVLPDGVLIDIAGFVGGAGAVQISGIDMGAAPVSNGRWKILVNRCGQTVTLKHNDGSSSLGNLIFTPNGTDLVMRAGSSNNDVDAVLLVYLRANSGPTAYVWLALPWTPTLNNMVAHNILSAQHLDTVTATLVRGGLLRVNSTPKLEQYALGAAGWVLGSDGSDAVYLDRRTCCLTTNPTSTSTALATVGGGLSFASLVAGGIYQFEFEITWSTNTTTTTGIWLAVNGPASPSWIRYATHIRSGGVKAFADEDVRAYNAGNATVGGSDSAGNANTAVIKGTLANGSNGGTLDVRFASEISGDQVQLWAGSSGWIHRVG